MYSLPMKKPAELEELSNYDIEPAGPMKEYLGKRYSKDELHLTGCKAKDRRCSIRVRAYAVSALIGIEFSVLSKEDPSIALRKVFTERMPTIIWEKIDGALRILEKYQFIHTIIPAPMDDSTNQEMAIELLANVVNFDGLPIDSEKSNKIISAYNSEYGIWLANRVLLLRNIPVPQSKKPLLPDLVLRIDAATYCNYQFPGIGIPCYL